MIPAITEVNFPSYATLHQATVSLQEMGDRSISTQVRINGSVVPDFTGWELQFKGERFVLPTRTPQAQKDNTTKNALVDLQFQSWVIEQLKSYFFVSLSEYETGKYIPDQYNASVILPLESFVQLFNKVLTYYFGTSIRMDLFGAGTPGLYSTTPVTVEINKTYIWDVLIKFYELFGVRWYIAYEQGTGAYVIKVGYAAEAITDHDFEYGYQGGLLKFERHVQDADVRNILIGRGGEKNLPYRYFKLQDPNNTAWEADPDAIPELANIYFDRLRDINFRWYVRGWMQNSHRDTSWDSTHTFPQYTENDCPESHLFAFRKGKTDESFDPVEYVKDDDSITKYGERWGAVDDNDGVYPTIQGMTRSGVGRVDECVAVSDIVTDDIDAAAATASTTSPIGGTKTITKTVPANGNATDDLLSEPFTIPSGQTGNIEYSWLNPRNQDGQDLRPDINLDATVTNLVAVDESTGTEYPIGGLQAGTYRIKITLKAVNSTSSNIQATYGVDTMSLVLSSVNENAWKPTFDIWVKNIWGTEFQDEEHPTETAAQYATRVWEKILGDRAGNEAKLVFSDGFMSTSQDYEFVIAAYPVFDQGKTITVIEDGQTKTYTSEWKITLYKSDAEFEATGLYIPNSTTGGKPSAGDHFFFIGIDMPFLYVTAAEERLNGADLTPVVNKTAALEDLADVQPTWVITLDKVRVNTLEAGEYGRTLAERLSAGATVRIKDPRFTPGQTLTLYVKSITYTWNEPTSGNPYLVPDIEVVLSDTVAAVEGTVTRVTNELNVVKATYAKSTDVEAAVRSVGNALFLKKTGESDNSNSPTTFASKVSSKSFRQGDIGGAGWGFYEEETEEEERNDSVLEIDKLVVRKELHVNELVANQISYVGGKKITSAAAIECTQVIEDNSYYYCYFDQKQGTVANLFQVGDFAMGQDFDEGNVEVRYYRMQVAEVGANYIKLSKSVKDGSGAPAVGDTIIQYGNPTDTTRQFVIVEDVIGGGYQRMLSGLNTVSASGKEYYFAGRQPNVGERWFVGDANGEHAEWKNGQLNVKGRFSVLKQDGTYESMSDYINSMDYLRAATNEGTLIDGGLVLTSMIQLGYTASQVYHVMAGINGKPDETLSDQTRSIAAWFGGPMVDKDAAGSGSGSGTGDSYAKSLFRMDGSGYLAGGNIYWNKQGYGGIPGVTWSREGGQDIVTIGGNVKLVSASGDTVTELLTAVQSLTSMFEDETYVDGSQTKHRIKVKSGYAGLYAEGFLTAGGVGSGGSGGQGVDLPRVWQSLQNASDPVTPTANTKIAASHLVTTDPYETVGLILGQGLSYNPNTRVLSVSTLGTVTSVAGVSPVNGDVPVASLRTALGLGDAAYKGIGSVANGNTDLVTGGSVYSAINSAISSAIKFQGITTTPLTDGSTTQTITIDGESYTAQRGDEVIYGGKEFLWTGSKWQQLGDEESWALKTVSITGTGYLTGGGTLEQNRTIDLTSAAGTKLENGATAYGWGNHANAGYLLATTAANTYATITDLNGVSGRVTTLENRQNWDDIFGIDSDGNVYVKKRTVSGQEIARGFYSYSFVTAGGVGSGGGGGGGVDLPRVWQSLTNASALVESGTSTKIHTDHFPTLSAANGLTASYGTPSGSGSTLSTSLAIGVSPLYKLPTTSEWSSKADASALANYVSGVSINGNYLRVTKGGVNSDLTVPYSEKTSKFWMPDITATDGLNIWEPNYNYLGIYKNGGYSTGAPSGYPYGYLMNFRWDNSNWSAQLYLTVSDYGHEIFTRGYRDDTDTWTTWKQFWNTGNLVNPLTASNYSSYLGSVYHPYGGSSTLDITAKRVYSLGPILITRTNMGDSYDEGLRIVGASNEWCGIFLGTADSWSGYQSSMWAVSKSNVDTFVIYRGLEGANTNFVTINNVGVPTFRTSSSDNFAMLLKSSTRHAGLVIDAAANYNPFIQLRSGGTAKAEIGYEYPANRIYLGEANTAAGVLNIDLTNNRVGINTDTPGYGLDVSGTFNATTIYQNGVALGSNAFSSTAYLPLSGGSGSQMVGSIYSQATYILRNYADSVFVAQDITNGGLYLHGTGVVYMDTPLLKRTWSGSTYTVWDSGNDGAGSGLDADLLDGVHNGNLTSKYINLIQGDSDFNFWDGAEGQLGIHMMAGVTNHAPDSAHPYGYLFNFAWGQGSYSWSGQLYYTVSDFGSEIYTRGYRVDQSTWTDWRKFYHSMNSNISSVDWTCKSLYANSQSSISYACADGDPALLLNDTRSDSTYWHYVMSGLSSSCAYEHNTILTLGKANASYNAALFGHHYSGNDNDSNYVFLGIYGRTDYGLKMFGTGNVVIGDRSGTTDYGYKMYVAGDGYFDATITDASTPVFTLKSSYGGGWGRGLDILYPYQPAGYNMTAILFGKQHSTNDQGTLNFCFVSSGSTSNYLGLGFYANDNLLKVYASGNVVIGEPSSSDYGYRLHVAGVIHSSIGIFSDGYVTAGAAQSASDRRLKGNIRDLQRDPIALIKLLRPREWDWNQYSTVQGHAMGFVAQEVQNYLPFMIGSVKDEHLGNRLTLGYDQFHALWAAGLQDHESRIDKLERENSELKQKVQELQNRLQTINN